MAIINVPTGYSDGDFSTREAFVAHMKANILTGLKVKLGRITKEDPDGEGDQWIARMEVRKKDLSEILTRINIDHGAAEAVDPDVLEEVWQGCRD